MKTDFGGGLIPQRAGTGSDVSFDVSLWRAPYRFAVSMGTFDAFNYSVGRIGGMSAGPDGRIYVLEKVRGTFLGADVAIEACWLIFIGGCFSGANLRNAIKMVRRPRSAKELWVLGWEDNLWSIQCGASVPVKTQGRHLTAVTLGFGDSGLMGFVFCIRYRKAGSTNRSDVCVA